MEGLSSRKEVTGASLFESERIPKGHDHRMLELHGLPGLPEVLPGMDLSVLMAQALAGAGLIPHRQDVLVVTQKIVSKAEGRFVDLKTVEPGAEAQLLAQRTFKDPRLVELVLRESRDVIRVAPNVLITRHHLGHVMANAGIDRSNTGPGGSDLALLLPVDADASAGSLRLALEAYFEAPPAVIISDSFGRPWRLGTVSVAIGAAGLPAIVDQRGDLDREGRELMVTQIALADQIASAAGLVAGEAAEGLPAVLVRGLEWRAPACPASAVLRPVMEDLFR